MKTILFSILSLAGLASVANAQVLSERAARNVLIGGIAGAIIGENNHHHAAEGALIGAAAGAVWTAATQNPSRSADVVYAQPACEPASRVIVVEEPPVRRTVIVRRPARTVVIHRPVVEQRVIVREAVVHHPSHRKVVKVVEPGCAPHYVEVIE